MLSVEHLTYTYPRRDRPALDGVDLDLSEGEVVLLAGCSGSGKSTLLRACNGLVPRFYGGRFAGRVVVGGLDTRDALPQALAGKVGFVFQEPEGRFLTSTVVDELAFGLEIAGLPSGTIRRRVAEILDRLELADLVERPLDRLSGGEQQRVAVAAALVRQPELLLLDEPTSQLDSHSADAVLAWVTDLRQRFGLAALIAEHRLARLLPLVDRVLCLPETAGPGLLGKPDDVLPHLPFAPPLERLGQAWGLAPPLDERGLAALRARAAAWPAAPKRPTPSGEPCLSARGLCFAYNGIPALQGADLAVRPGEVVALLGRNGSGKTTLLRALMGLVRPSAGEVRLDGDRLDDRSVPERARRIGYVPQWPSALLFAETVRDELWITLRNHGMTARPPVDPQALLDGLGLSGVAGHYPRDLSAGERQRAAIGAVSVTRPSLMLLDEPTLGVDPLAQQAVGRLLEGWRREGMAVVLATHDVEFAALHADRAIVLERGRVVAEGPTAEVLFDQPQLRTALQRLTGQPRPASPEEILAGQVPGGADADD